MCKVGCAGILVADIFCGPISELPREGELTAVDEMPLRPGGCAANVAIDLAKQDVEVEVLGCLGADSDAQMLRASLESSGVACDRLVQTSDYATSKTVVLLIEGQDRRFIHLFGANQAFTVDHIDRQWLKNLAVFYLGGLFAMPKVDPEELRDLLHFCRQHDVASVVDVVVSQDFSGQKQLENLLPYVDYFVPNDHEAGQITGQVDPIDQLRALQDWGAKAVIITKGGDGVVASEGNTYWECGTYDVAVRDPSGAGDAFASGIIAGVLQQWTLPQILPYASVIGASSVRAVGTTTSVFTAEEASSFVNLNPMEITTGTLN